MSAQDRSLAVPWRPHTEQPAVLQTTALIAVPVQEGAAEPWVAIVGFHYWSAEGWRDEDDDALLVVAAFWWLDEAELVAGLLPAPAARGMLQ